MYWQIEPIALAAGDNVYARDAIVDHATHKGAALRSARLLLRRRLLEGVLAACAVARRANVRAGL